MQDIGGDISELVHNKSSVVSGHSAAARGVQIRYRLPQESSEGGGVSARYHLSFEVTVASN